MPVPVGRAVSAGGRKVSAVGGEERTNYAQHQRQDAVNGELPEGAWLP